MKESKPVKLAVLEVLIREYPIVKTHLIHKAHPFSVTSDVRLRELRKQHNLIINYAPRIKSYIVLTKKDRLEEIHKAMKKEAA